MNKDPDLSDEQEDKKKPKEQKSINLEKPGNVEKPPPQKHVSQKKMSFAEKCTWDYILSYETTKELNVLDRLIYYLKYLLLWEIRRLGYTYIICFLIVFTYILVYVGIHFFFYDIQ